MRRIATLLLLAAASACARDEPAGTAVCDARVFRSHLDFSSRDPVDILLVLDASPEMAEERRHFLEVQWPRALQFLLRGVSSETPDVLRPVGSLRVGVVASELAGCAAGAPLRNGERCAASRGSYVWHFHGAHDVTESERALRCLADIDADSCPVSQPLEAALEALSVPNADGGLLRDSSFLIIVILTNRDDASIGGRSAREYVDALRAVRPEHEQLLVPIIIAGAPPAWTSGPYADAHMRAPTQLASAYDMLLPTLQAGATSCTSATATATAPIGLLQFARAYGFGAEVLSICDYDLALALQRILDPGFDRLPLWCVGPGFAPNSAGFVPCRVTWELPLEAVPEEPLTPARCEDRSDVLTVPPPGLPQRSTRGRVLCEERQTLAVRAADGTIAPQGDGFFIDIDPLSARRCHGGTPMSFSERGRPPNFVTVQLECVDATQHAAVPGSAVAIGDVCNVDAPCGDGQLLCHPQTKRCVLACDADAQCPAGWGCERDAALDARICIKAGCE